MQTLFLVLLHMSIRVDKTVFNIVVVVTTSCSAVASTSASSSSSSVPYNRMSSYRSKYLQEKEQLGEARKKLGEVDSIQQTETAATDDEKNEGKL